MRRRGADVVEVWSLPADDAAKRDHGVESSGFRDGASRLRDLVGAGDGKFLDVGRRRTGLHQRGARAAGQLGRDPVVEPRDDQRKAKTCRAGEHRAAIRGLAHGVTVL